MSRWAILIVLCDEHSVKYTQLSKTENQKTLPTLTYFTLCHFFILKNCVTSCAEKHIKTVAGVHAVAVILCAL